MDEAEMTVVKTKVDGRVVQLEIRESGPIEEDVRMKDFMSFDGVADSIEAISRRMMTTLANIKPQKAAVEFGVDIGVESGALTALIAKGTGTASMKITLEWESSGDGAGAAQADG